MKEQPNKYRLRWWEYLVTALIAYLTAGEVVKTFPAENRLLGFAMCLFALSWLIQTIAYAGVTRIAWITVWEQTPNPSTQPRTEIWQRALMFAVLIMLAVAFGRIAMHFAPHLFAQAPPGLFDWVTSSTYTFGLLAAEAGFAAEMVILILIGGIIWIKKGLT